VSAVLIPEQHITRRKLPENFSADSSILIIKPKIEFTGYHAQVSITRRAEEARSRDSPAHFSRNDEK
jgi:hypothetical protein